VEEVDRVGRGELLGTEGKVSEADTNTSIVKSLNLQVFCLATSVINLEVQVSSKARKK
jgi:hypothetical protein